MRALIIAAGLSMAATGAWAGSQDDVVARANSNNIALANGCVYAPAAQPNAWYLVYTPSGPAAHCAVSVRSRAAQPAAQTQVAYRPAAGAALQSDFVTGVFR